MTRIIETWPTLNKVTTREIEQSHFEFGCFGSTLYSLVKDPNDQTVVVPFGGTLEMEAI